MIVLVANLGSTSFKYKLFDLSTDGLRADVLASGAADRIGQGSCAWRVDADVCGRRDDGTADLSDHGAAIDVRAETDFR